MPSIALSLSSITPGTNWTDTGGTYPCVGAPDPGGSPGVFGPATGSLLLNFAVPGGQSVPGTATITGYSLTVSRDASAGGNVVDSSVTVTVGGKGLSDEASGASWPGTTGDATYGGASDLWGDAAPTPAQVNSTGGTVSIAIKTDSTGGIGYVRNVLLAVNYTLPAEDASLMANRGNLMSNCC